MSLGKSVAIIGGGIAGLTALHELKKHGINAALYEKDERVGGRIKTYHIDGASVELGGGFFSDYYPGFIRLVDELGLSQVRYKINGAGVLVKDGKIVPISPGSFLLGRHFNIADGLSVAGILPDIWKHAKAYRKAGVKLDTDHSADPFDVFEADRVLAGSYNENFYDYLRGKVSRKVADDLADPACRTIVFESAREMNRFVGMGVFVSGTTQLYGMDGGMENVTTALKHELLENIHLGEAVEHVARDGEKYSIQTSRGERTADFVIATTPIPQLREFAPARAEDMEYSRTRMTVVRAKLRGRYDDGRTEHYLIADRENGINNITRYSADVFMVGSGDEPNMREFFDGFEIVHSQLWDPALPKLSPGAKLPPMEDETGTFFLAGNYYMPCIEMSVQTGKNAALRISKKLKA